MKWKLALIIFLSCSTLCMAAPDATTVYLQGTSVSVFDFGMYRLTLRFKEEIGKILRPIVDMPADQMNLLVHDITYDKAQDKIFVAYLGIMTGQYDSKEKADAKITEIITALHEWIGPWDVNGKHMEEFGPIYDCFHTDSHSRSDDPGLYYALERKVELQAVVAYRQADGAVAYRRGSLELYGKAIEFTDTDPKNLTAY